MDPQLPQQHYSITTRNGRESWELNCGQEPHYKSSVYHRGISVFMTAFLHKSLRVKRSSAPFCLGLETSKRDYSNRQDKLKYRNLYASTNT